MHRITLTLLALCLTISAAVAAPKPPPAPAQEIPLLGSGPAYYVVAIMEKNIVWEFQLDTGATDVLIPWDLFNLLWKEKLIDQSNMLPDKVYVHADGTSRPYLQARMHLTIGTHRLDNVTVGIGNKGEPVSSLLGARVLQRFTSFGIDHTRGILRLGQPQPVK